MDENVFQAVEGLDGPLYLWQLWFLETLTIWQLASRDGVEGLRFESNPRLEFLHNIFQKHLWL